MAFAYDSVTLCTSGCDYLLIIAPPIYRNFHQWVESSMAEGIDVDPEFVTGVRLGIGCFNLVS